MKRGIIGLISVILVLSNFSSVLAISKSNNYEVNEYQFGSGGELNASSANYSSQESLGATANGVGSSTHYTARSGFLTPGDPFLQMIVTPANINLGLLSTSSTATGTGQFNVTSYVDSGYVVLSENNPPTQEDGYSLHNMSTAAASSTGTEQFGINLVQNTTGCSAPANFGANPVPEPSSSFANGEAASGYNTCGLFKYNIGDTVAQSSTNGWGETIYTISYIVNVNTTSRAGIYTMTQNLVAVPTF